MTDFGSWNFLKQVEIEENSISNINVIRAYNYLLELLRLHPIIAKIINDYRAEPECDEWENTDKPLISFRVINWLLKRKINITYSYIPQELLCEHITDEEILKQQLYGEINNAEIMNNALYSFPRIEYSGINVFRGVNKSIFDIIMKTTYSGQVTIPYFQSTSLFIDAATRFADGTRQLMSIYVPNGFPLPYVSSSLNHICEDNFVCEAEVIIPINATLKFIKRKQEQGFTINCYVLIGFASETRQLWTTYETIVDKLIENGLFNDIQSQRPKMDETVGGKKQRNKIIKRNKTIKRNKRNKTNKKNKSNKRKMNKSNKRRTISKRNKYLHH